MKNLVWGILLLLFAFGNAYQWTFNQPVRRVRWGLNQERVYYTVPQGFTARDYFNQLMASGDQSASQNLEKSGISEIEDGDAGEVVNGVRSCHCGKCLRCVFGRRPVVANKDQEQVVGSENKHKDEAEHSAESTQCNCGSCDGCLLKRQEEPQRKPTARLFGLGSGGYTGMMPGLGYDPYYSRPNYGYGYPEYYESYYEGAYPYDDPYYRPYNSYW